MTTKTAFIVHCGKCKHEWTAFYLPMPLDIAAAIGKSLRCPMCETNAMGIFCGPAPVDEINTSSKRVKKTEES